ncbi:DUF3800 domain-containing protein [Mycobacterium marinum]|uniref:DUF3800 domain-containing protein n=1 Tax=Mycobacterium marinum TaxID=1781 RepID=UPI0023595AC4|nr:DUF3800 domain-containing protein [Mycobacterium marinum]MDC8973995.1 DUF3800 domain-containing protein [Mycobacterium marinum]
MLLAYLDESYDKVEYWLTALMVPADAALKLQQDLNGIVYEACMSSYGVHWSAELHGHQILHGEGEWERMGPKVRARIGIYRKAFEAIATCEGVEIVMRGVNIPNLKARYGANAWHPHRVAIDFVAQSCNSMAAGRSTHFLAIADEIDQADTLRASYWNFQNYGTLSSWTKTIDRSLDALHFAPSKHSRLLQAADLVSYLHFRRRRSRVKDPRSVKTTNELWEIVADIVKVWQIWP